MFLYLAYVLLFCAYYNDESSYKSSRKGEKVKFPIWLYIVAAIVSIMPFFNFIGAIGICIWMYQLSDEEDVVYRTFLFKKR